MIFRYYPKIHFYTHFWNWNSRKKNSSTPKKNHFRSLMVASEYGSHAKPKGQSVALICSSILQDFIRFLKKIFFYFCIKEIYLLIYQVDSDSEMYFLNLNLLWLPYPEAFTSVLRPRKTFEEIRMTNNYTIVIERLVWIITKSFQSNA